MKHSKSDSSQPVLPNKEHRLLASRLTAELPAAIATILVEGADAIETVQQLVQLQAKTLAIGNIHYGLWQISSDYSEQVVVCRISEQAVEIHCHGGQAVCQAILRDLQLAGSHILSMTEWQHWHQQHLRATVCPLSLAAEQDLLLAQTERAAAILLDQFNGALRSRVLHALSELASGSIGTAIAAIDSMLELSQLGLHLTTPWKVVLAGPPNVGKSSLSNALVGQAQAIVHHEPGTTRDWLQTITTIDGWPVALTDTAGIRVSNDPIETAGVARAQQQITQADVVLLVVDGSVGWTETHQQVFDAVDPAQTVRLIVWNKGDVAPTPPCELIDLACLIVASSLGAPGVQELIAVLGKRLCPNPPKIGAAIPFRVEQVSRLRDARDALANSSFEDGKRQLQSLIVAADE